MLHQFDGLVSTHEFVSAECYLMTRAILSLHHMSSFITILHRDCVLTDALGRVEEVGIIIVCCIYWAIKVNWRHCIYPTVLQVSDVVSHVHLLHCYIADSEVLDLGCIDLLDNVWWSSELRVVYQLRWLVMIDLFLSLILSILPSCVPWYRTYCASPIDLNIERLVILDKRTWFIKASLHIWKSNRVSIDRVHCY